MEKHASRPASPASPSHQEAAAQHTTPPSSNVLLSYEPSSSQEASHLQLSDQSSSPLVDLERHPKGKRKRTAAKDKAVLEAAYQANPKPDKAARLDIVKRVSLNEKEVQIWFQNRRQNDRRKSRPLSPQEIAALRYGGMQILSSDPAAPHNTSPNSSSNDQFSSQGISFTEPRPTSPAHSLHSDSGVFHFEGVASAAKPEENTSNEQLETSPIVLVEGSSQEVETMDESFQLSRSFPGSVGYLSNRWNPGSSFSTPSTLGHPAGDESIRLEPFSLSTCSAPSTTPILPAPSSQSQSSQFRLSLSLEGKAQVIESTTPPHLPPPRPSAEVLASLPPVRRPSFHRSHSAQSSVTLPPLSALTSSLPPPSSGALPPRLTRGRSRDVHAWEFACEADSQEDPLIAQAKHESSGSAIAVISLLRSTSSSGANPTTGSPLQPSSGAKRNAAASKAAPRQGVAKKPKLSRAASSVARLQTSFESKRNALASTAKEVVEINGGEDMKDKAPKFSMLVSPSGNESDKENWSPDEDGNPHYRFTSRPDHSTTTTSAASRRPLPSAQNQNQNPRRTMGRNILQESRGSAFLGNRSNTAPVPNGAKRAAKGAQPLLEIFEDSPGSSGKENGAGVDNEVERFMRGEVSPSKKGDVDAVAGLLSLSQGNWR